MEGKDKYDVIEKIIRQATKALFAYDVDAASFIFLNDAFNQLWRRTKESVIANPAIILSTIHPDDRAFLEKEYEELLHGILKKDVEFRILLPDKRARWIRISPQLVIDSSGKKIIAGILDNITEVKDNIRNLEKFAAKKNSILEILSHDLAGPLANIQALAEMLAESTKGYNDKDVQNTIRIIGESSARSVQMIRAFVQQEFLESANAGMYKRRLDVVEKVGEVMEQYKAGENLIPKNFTLIAPQYPVYAAIDQDKFMQVINNLISNAIKFTPEHGKIDVEIVDKDEDVLFIVRDNGIGIPKKYQNELFDKFTRARRAGLRGEPSTGLGMSIIKTIVEWHDGRIWFESEENKGTTFYIKIPKL